MGLDLGRWLEPYVRGVIYTWVCEACVYAVGKLHAVGRTVTRLRRGLLGVSHATKDV